MPNPPTQQLTHATVMALNPAVSVRAMRWKAGSNKGPRQDNQDCALVPPPEFAAIQTKGVLLVLCDGVGGEEGGHLASQAAAHEAQQTFYNDTYSDTLQSLLSAIARANASVQRESNSQPRFARMGTTAVFAAVYNGVLYVAHVGDSRAYLLRSGQLVQLTRDHTFANAQIDSGGMTVEQAQRSIYRGTLVRSLGMLGDHTPDTHVEKLTPGDRVLLCSDGLHGAVSSQQITRILNDTPDTGVAVAQLLSAALANQTPDNVSAIVLNYGEVARTPVTSATAAIPGGRKPKLLIPAVIAIAILALFAGLIVASGLLKNSGGVSTSVVTATAPAPAQAVATATPTTGITPQGARATTATAPAAVRGMSTGTPTVSRTLAAPTSVTPGTAPSATEMPDSTSVTDTPTPESAATSTLVPTPSNTPTPKPTRTPTPLPTETTLPTLAPSAVPPTNTPAPPPPQQSGGGGGNKGGGGGGGGKPPENPGP